MSRTSITDLNRRLDQLTDRLAAMPVRMDKAKNCVKGVSCGNTCIPKGKTCKAKAGPAAAELAQLVKAGPTAAPAGAPAARNAAPKAPTKAAAAPSPAPVAEPTPTSKATAKPAAGLPKAPTAKQLADQEAKVEGLMANAKGPGGSKHISKLTEAKAKLKEMQEIAADPEGFVRNKEAAAKREQQWEATQDKLDERQRAATKKLTLTELEAIADYTDEAGDRPYAEVNKCARRTPCRNRKASQHIKELDAALAKVPANKDGDTFYRGMGVTPGSPTAKLYKMLENAKPGTQLEDPGFASYSSRESVADSFMIGEKTIKFVSRNKNLRPINTFSMIEMEYEALLPRNATSTIRSVTKQGGTLIVELD